MKVGFFHDARIYKGEDKQMYSIGFSYTLWERYLEVFDQMVICTREADEIINDYSNYKVSSGENVSFGLNKVYKNPMQILTKPKKVIQPISEVVEGVDACIIRLPSVIGILAVRECIKKNKPWAVEIVACCWDTLWNHGGLKGKLFAPILHSLTKYYISKSKYSIYVSEQFLQKVYPCNGLAYAVTDVNIDDTDPLILDKRIDKIRKRNEKSITLGMIGSLNVEFKGHKSAIKIVRDLRQKGYNVKLRCLGGGDKSKWIHLCEQMEVEELVEFCGILPAGSKVLEWIDDIDIFIMPSLSEGMPRSMIEAMSRGCNVVGNSVGGITELLEDNFLSNPKHYKEMLNIIIKLINDKEMSIEQSKRNFNFVNKYKNDKTNEKRREFFNIYKEECKIMKDNNNENKFKKNN